MNQIPDLNAGRQSALVRFKRRLFSHRIMRRVLIGAAAGLTVILVIYARVDWHGQHVWEQAKHDMAANGEIWDWAAFAPRPVADDENIFSAPKMAEWFGDARPIFAAPLDHRITNVFASRFANPDSTANIQSSTVAARYVAWSDQFQNDFDTIAAALNRPYARMTTDYSKPFSVTFPNSATLAALVHTLVQRGKCHLILGQTDKAWQDLALLQNLRRMVDRQGRFITTEEAWMNREITRHALEVIAAGIQRRAWTEPQLASLQEQLQNIDVIRMQADALNCGRSIVICSTENGALLQALATSRGGSFWTRAKDEAIVLAVRVGPRGVLSNRAASASENFRSMIHALTPGDGIVRPASVSQAFRSWKRAQDGLPQLLRTQTLINEGAVACALERYRLTHAEYPETLDRLFPQLIEKLPRDIVNGEPLIYRRTTNGSFLLYSVGWNEKDDGGQRQSVKSGIDDPMSGDWVWENASASE